jgi:putative SOS response-associated peptidase YedK
MCGRYTISNPHRCIAEFSVLEKQPALEPRFNVAPSQGVWVVRIVPPASERRLDLLRWGLLVPKAKAPGGIVMARVESIAARAPFAAAFRTRRCLLLADGFYEWKRAGKQSFPYYIRRPNNGPFAMAGIWAPSPPETAGAPLDSCAIVTIPARPPVESLHDRMPAILATQHHDAWLDPTFDDTRALKDMLADGPGFELVTVPVASRVNSPANDDASCIEPISERDRRGEQMDLWAAR